MYTSVCSWQVEALNSFEAYVFSLRHTLEEKGFEAKLPTEDFQARVN